MNEVLSKVENFFMDYHADEFKKEEYHCKNCNKLLKYLKDMKNKSNVKFKNFKS